MTSFVFTNFATADLNYEIEANATTIIIDADLSKKFAQPTGGDVQRCVLNDDTQPKEIVDITAQESEEGR